MAISKEKQTALRLMGVKPQCKRCAHWGARDAVGTAYHPVTKSRAYCKPQKNYKLRNDGKRCSYFSPKRGSGNTNE